MSELTVSNMRFQNRELESLSSKRYTADSVSQLEEVLRKNGALTFVSLPSGLFPASTAGDTIAASGYSNVWVRDNVYVAHAHELNGRTEVATQVASALVKFFHTQRQRFEDTILGVACPTEVLNRPHVRFDGQSLSEISGERWAHAQNDALGYFLWLYSRLAGNGHAPLGVQEVETLVLFPRYFDAISYWEDEDSGHWEEARKISASSIGTVVAGLEAFLQLLRAQPDTFAHHCHDLALEKLLTNSLARGRAALESILPNECSQLTPSKNRRYDAALLFLIFPLSVVKGPIAELILHDANRFLKGAFGIRRYLGDSYWAPDYEKRLPAKERTKDFSESMALRDTLLEDVGDEAQWCLFDPILSAHYGRCFLETGLASAAEQQIYHFNRALSQITPSWKCPELYYLRNGEYVSNPHVPLQWTQANLLMALESMKTTAAQHA